MLVGLLSPFLGPDVELNLGIVLERDHLNECLVASSGMIACS